MDLMDDQKHWEVFDIVGKIGYFVKVSRQQDKIFLVVIVENVRDSITDFFVKTEKDHVLPKRLYVIVEV